MLSRALSSPGTCRTARWSLTGRLLARPRQTLVVYMGLMALPLLCSRLIEHGRAPDTPAAVVQQATRRDQRVVVATLETLPQCAAQAGLKAPTVILVGEVVALRRQVAACLLNPRGTDFQCADVENENSLGAAAQHAEHNGSAPCTRGKSMDATFSSS